MPSPDLQIRTNRAAFNRAIAGGDAAAIAPLLARDCVMVTGTDSAVIAGRNAQVKVWQREFASPNRLIYTRLPTAITVSAIEPIALEQGEWRGVPQGSDIAAASGVYSPSGARDRRTMGDRGRGLRHAWVSGGKLHLISTIFYVITLV